MKFFIVLSLLSISLFGVMADPKDMDLGHNDGSKFKANMFGDEWFSWKQTKDGYVVDYNPKSKNYEYMTIDENDEFKHSNVKVKTDVKPSPSGQVGIHRAAAKTSLNLSSNVKKISKDKLEKMWTKARKKARDAGLARHLRK